jgi:hypothetical protein
MNILIKIAIYWLIGLIIVILNFSSLTQDEADYIGFENKTVFVQVMFWVSIIWPILVVARIIGIIRSFNK